MKQTSFEKNFGDDWKTLKSIIAKLDDNSELSHQERSQFCALYRQVCHHQSLAKTRCYSTHLVDELTNLVLAGHQHLYRRKRKILAEWLQFIIRGFPSVVRQEARFIWAATALFYLPGLLLFFGVLINGDLIYSVLPEANVSEMEMMYDPTNQRIGDIRESDTDLFMFGFYIYNNISVAFRTFASGIALGLGSLYFIIYNGIIIGAISGHMTNVGFVETFFPFVVGHGSFELTAIAIAGAAGMKLGFSILRPGNLSRLDALKQSGAVAIQLMYGVIGFLVIAAFIEAFWSSSSWLEPWQKYTVGGILWFIVIVYLTRSGIRRES